MAAKVDLHTHTYYSDGALSPTELVIRARELGIGILSITDHDSIDAFPQALAAAKDEGVEIIPGVELSATLGTKDIHILGYMFDPSDKTLRDILDMFKRERMARAERIVEKLNRLDLPLRISNVSGMHVRERLGSDLQEHHLGLSRLRLDQELLAAHGSRNRRRRR